MRPLRWLLALALAAGLVGPAAAENKKLLLVTDSGGFIHDSVGLAEQVLKEIGPKHGFDVTCYRFTRDPSQTVKVKRKENCGRVNADTLKKFDCVLFFTTGNPLNNDEVKDLVEWVKAGGAIAGTHCGSDTLYPAKDRPWNSAYGELIGAYFDGHPWHQKIRVVVEDQEHPAAHGVK